MFITYPRIICLSIITFSFFNCLGQDIDKLIPIDFQISQIANGNLNLDTLEDCAIIIQKSFEMESDTKELWILFKKPNNTYEVSLKLTNFITVRYDNEISIENRKLLVKAEHPWHGVNFSFYEFQYFKNDWICLKASSFHYSGDEIGQDWTSKIDFVTGKYEFTHTFVDYENINRIRNLIGVKQKSSPPSITKIDYGEILTIQNSNKEYYIWDRNDLWTESEIIELKSISSDLIIGSWYNLKNLKIKLQLKTNGQFEFFDYDDKTKKFENLKGNFNLEGRTLTLKYFDRKSQKFTLEYQDYKLHIKKIGGFDFIQKDE